MPAWCDGKCFDVLDAFYECGVNLNARSNKYGNVLTSVAQHNVNGGPKGSLKVFRYLIKEASYSKQFDVNMICKIIAPASHNMPPRENHLLQIIFSSFHGDVSMKRGKYQPVFEEMLRLALDAGASPSALFMQYDDWTKRWEPCSPLCIVLSYAVALGAEQSQYIDMFRLFMRYSRPALRRENIDKQFEAFAMPDDDSEGAGTSGPLRPAAFALFQESYDALEILLCSGATMTKRTRQYFEQENPEMARRYKAAIKSGKTCDMCAMFVMGKKQNKLLLCSGCNEGNKRQYCSKECQKRDWKKGHRKTCAITLLKKNKKKEEQKV